MPKSKIMSDARRLGVVIDLNERYDRGLQHHAKSLAVAEVIRELDDSGEFKFGGDGDIGEMILTFLDVYFETCDARKRAK